MKKFDGQQRDSIRAQTEAALARPVAAFIFKKALISALVALVLFSLMIGIRTEAGPTGQLIYWTRFAELAGMVAAVFFGSIAVELLRLWWGPVGTVMIVPPTGAERAGGWRGARSPRCC